MSTDLAALRGCSESAALPCCSIDDFTGWPTTTEFLTALLEHIPGACLLVCTTDRICLHVVTQSITGHNLPRCTPPVIIC